MPSRRRHTIDPLQLKAGDIVVHEQHGVGRYIDMVQRTVQGATREYLVVEYAPSKRGQPGDRLYVPTDQLDQVTQYVGGEAPSLDKMGGGDWAKRKGRAKKAVKEIAAELIRLYSARMATRGHQFGPDSPWQRELEDAFPFAETPDQLRTIDEVKTDMMSEVPMDRLICGDVGYGKTEIAVRAAFKAVMDGKQVAVLVPTTLLAQQHFSTFAERYANFPVTVRRCRGSRRPRRRRLSSTGCARATSTSSSAPTASCPRARAVQGPRPGHRRRGAAVRRRAQGGAQAMRTSVDVLTMSATPIPRTLEMAHHRHPRAVDDRHPARGAPPGADVRRSVRRKQIAAAIRRELLREGQVFYVHNRVESIDQAAARLRDLVPEARIGTAHGQMGEDALEAVMLALLGEGVRRPRLHHDRRVGIDISNANTLIVDRADVFGLSQLHQIRGRVGRARERAYAYFLYPTREAADGDRARPARHHRPAHRARRRHGRGHEGPRDPRRRQPARRRAVRTHRRRRLRPLHPAGRRGGRRVPRRRAAPSADGQGRAARRRAHPARLRHRAAAVAATTHTAGSAEWRPLAAEIEVRDELNDRYGPPPEPVENLFAVAAFRAARPPRTGSPKWHPAGPYMRFGPDGPSRVAAAAAAAALPAHDRQGGRTQILVPRPMSGQGGRATGGRPGAARLGAAGRRRRAGR